ncbi:hypothetical protein HMPREF9080_02213 [Cardiobacterium valvarum F0432]|uniref:Uncharacterized protein n=1 Tax=Cardiobacterium valvarum F0432 TaxID=797473 RepID=G9ZHI3_9GAMM|nr:hypothetical protein HMPREF9080_02213 [Cardiobacterium valvarum F0432]
MICLNANPFGAYKFLFSLRKKPITFACADKMMIKCAYPQET